MEIRDFIIGKVIAVTDEHTLRIEVTHVGGNNRRHYGEEEKVHIEHLKPTEIVSFVGKRTKKVMKRMLLGKEVLCMVTLRKPGGTIEGDVYMRGRTHGPRQEWYSKL